MNAVEARMGLVNAISTTAAYNDLPAPRRVYEEGDAIPDDEPLTKSQLVRLRGTQRRRERRTFEHFYRTLGFRAASARRLARHALHDLGQDSSGPTRCAGVAVSARPRECRSVRRRRKTLNRSDSSESSDLAQTASARWAA
jgi:hypothetical protein